MTQPFQYSTAFSLWSLSDKMFVTGAAFSAGSLPAMLDPNAQYIALGVQFEQGSNGKIIVTSSSQAQTCKVLSAAQPTGYYEPCDGSGPPPPYHQKSWPSDSLTLIADLSTLLIDGTTIWLQSLGVTYGPIGMWVDVASALAGVAASGPVGQVYWLLQVMSASLWVGGSPLGSAPTSLGSVPNLLGIPFYITIPVNL